MTTFLSLFAATMLIAADDPQAKPDAKAEMKKMEGTWTIEKIIQNGTEAKLEGMNEIRLEIRGNTRTIKRGDEQLVKGTYKIDPAASPKSIDVTVTEGPESIVGRTLPGIYELKGHTFKIAMTVEGKARPRDFEGGEGTVVQIFKRVKKNED